MNEKIENKELLKRILECLKKSDNFDFSEEELASIENIGFTRKLVNGQDTGIDIESILLFKNLKSLTLRNYELTMRDLQFISEHPSIEDISFLECTFENTDFDELSRLPEKLKFIYCSKLPLKFPKVKGVRVEFCEIDFSSIDFSRASSIAIKNSKIRNVQNLDDYDNILTVNLDGSELIKENGEIAEDITVAKNCEYTHREIDKYYVDDYEKTSVEENHKKPSVEEDYEK